MTRSRQARAAHLAAVAAVFCAVSLGSTELGSGTASAASPPLRVSSSDTLVRAALWVGQQVPYSQAAYAADIQGHLYRTDCSGFVSMAWGLGRSLTTRTLPAVATALGPVGDYADLQPGDALDSTSAHHVVLFVRWADPRHRTAVIMEEAHPGTAARIDATYYTTELLTQQAFVAYRYEGLVPVRKPVPRPVVPVVHRPVLPVYAGQSVGLLKLANDSRTG